MEYKSSVLLNGIELQFETGKMAKQADGAVVVRYGDTVILVTAVAEKEPAADVDFFPLTVEYRERSYAAGKFPGGFFKREGKPSDLETLGARLIDRPLRPLFPEHYYCEVQVIVTVLSYDGESDPAVLAVNGASAALCISDIPFSIPVGAVKVGRINGQLVLNPTFAQLEESDINLVVAGTDTAIMMVEGSAREVAESDMLAALKFAHQYIVQIIESQRALIHQCGKPKREVKPIELDPGLVAAVREVVIPKLNTAIRIADKTSRESAVETIVKDALDQFLPTYPEQEKAIKSIVYQAEYELVRKMILDEKRRADGRGYTDIRPITCEVGILPRTHGSALFTRGQTQSLAVTTLGTTEDEQLIDGILGETTKRFLFHYNFPPYSVGEVRPIRGPGRREIGHGNLAERSLEAVIPSAEVFPYTIRIVSDILESNGSSSMASVCGGTLSLMDAGVPIKSPVAGIAMGLVKEGERYAILSDIMGLEDHIGDMDFKVAGTQAGITGFQMDIKVSGVTFEIMEQAMEQAKSGRLFILQKMLETIAQPRPDISIYAPRIITMQIKPDQIRTVIGPGGKVIKDIISKTGTKIDIEDDGTVKIASVDEKAAQEAVQMIEYLTEEVEVGKIYLGKVTRILNFGAFVEILPGKEGLCHISQLDDKRISKVEDVVHEGDTILVKVIEIDDQGRINLSRKLALREKEKSGTRGVESRK
ncbi:MAG: polyribonucleotide nucleotidyltransferase [bacterium]|nr:polyribonucleotide nucleotidyltransferase [bacterium]